MLHVQFWYLSSISGTKWQHNEESVVSHSYLSLIRLVDLLKDRYSRVWIKWLDDYHHSTFVMNQTRAMLQIHVPLNPVGLLHFFYIRSGIHKPWKEKRACVHCTYIQNTKKFYNLTINQNTKNSTSPLLKHQFMTKTKIWTDALISSLVWSIVTGLSISTSRAQFFKEQIRLSNRLIIQVKKNILRYPPCRDLSSG